MLWQARLPRTLALTLSLAGCSGTEAGDVPGTGGTASGGAGGVAGSAGTGGVEAAPDGTLPSHPSQLPFSYSRPDKGTPLSAAELDQATTDYLDLLSKLRYFEFLDERVHGWPESSGGYWYGTWWSGADVIKQSGKLTYRHNDVGGDNNGLRTAPLMEGVCFAHALWKKPKHEKLLRRLIRGFSSWSLAMVTPGGEPEGALLTRAAYLENFTDTDRDLSVDYSLNRPGKDNGATEYVQIAKNPSFGDIWVKNKRSKDDIGHMLRAASQLDSCASSLSAAGKQDLSELRRLYVTWARRVEDDEWKIATYDKSLKVWYPAGLATFSLLGNAECTPVLSIRLFGRWAPRDDVNCGNGVGGLDTAISNANDQNGEILRSFHEAAANAALIANQTDLAQKLLGGLAQRLDQSLDGFEAGTPPKFMDEKSMSDLIVHSANAGVPLTSREVRFLHTQLKVAKQKLLSSSNAASLDTRSASVPDGSYAFEPSSAGVDFKSLGALLGTCAAQYRNPSGKPVFDCKKVAAGN